MKLVRENINFTRGLDPKEAMGIGQKALWDRLKPGDVLRITKSIPTLGKNRGDYLVITTATIQPEIKEPEFTGDEYNSRIMYYKFTNKTEAKKFSKKILNGEETNWGQSWHINYPFFVKYMEIVNIMNESINFERGLDPKEAMGIGTQTQFIKWMNQLRLTRSVGAINIVSRTQSISVDYYGDNFDEAIAHFPEDAFYGISEERSNHFRKTYRLFINPQYFDFFKNSFTKEGYIKD